MAVTVDLFRPVFVDETSTFASLFGPGRGGRQRNQQQILQPEDLPAVNKLMLGETVNHRFHRSYDFILVVTVGFIYH